MGHAAEKIYPENIEKDEIPENLVIMRESRWDSEKNLENPCLCCKMLFMEHFSKIFFLLLFKCI